MRGHVLPRLGGVCKVHHFPTAAMRTTVPAGTDKSAWIAL
jgi:hypothetical protein